MKAERQQTILLIDDDVMVRHSIRNFLEDCDYRVLETENGREGLKVFAQKKADLLLVDLRMPGMDGLEVLDRVAKESPDTPVIVVSGMGVFGDVIQALRRGAWDYIRKPIEDLTILKLAVEKALERARLIKENKQYQLHLEEEIQKRTRELKRVNAELVQAQKMESLGTLAGGIAHDFNNILMAILGFAELVADDLAEGSTALNNQQQVINAGLRARDLVKQILTFARREDQVLSSIFLYPIVKEVLKFIRSSIPASIKIEQDIDTESGQVVADPVHIHQVLMNLCTNAYHAMRDKGHGILKVSLKEQIVEQEDVINQPELPAGHYLKLAVSDTGCGMEPVLVEKIFDPYFTTKEKGEGTGLGLSVVLGIIKSCRGHVFVESKVGMGTTFSIYLPLAKREDLVGERESDDGPTISGHGRVLVVDDEEIIVDMVKRQLEKIGYDVVAITNSISALEVFKNDHNNVDLVITDMTMPHMTGVELARELRLIKAEIPIILCTGYSDRVDQKSANAQGLNFMMKPIVISELALMIREMMK